MNTQQKEETVKLIDELLKNNWALLELVQKLKPEDQLIYLPKVEKMIKETHKLISNDKGTNTQVGSVC